MQPIRPADRFWRLAGLAALLVLAPGCGAGVVGAVGAASGNDPGSDRFPALIGRLSVPLDSKTSPVLLEFVLTDDRARPTNVEIAYLPREITCDGSDGSELEAIVVDEEHLVETPQSTGRSLTALTTSHAGVEHRVAWDFAGQLGGGEYRRPGTWEIRIVDRNGAIADTERQANAKLGNDPPSILEAEFPLLEEEEEANGPIILNLRVADSSGDEVELEVEYSVGNAAPQRATSLGGTRPTRVVPAECGGTLLTFIWNVTEDLGRTDVRDVVLSVTPKDSGMARGARVETRSFDVDNNAPPAGRLDDAAILLGTDRRRAIPITFDLFDGESDLVEVVFQWRRPSQSFEDPQLKLPVSSAELREILRDSELRRRYQICSESPTRYGGRTDQVAESPARVRLPELSSSAAALLAPPGIFGDELTLLRLSTIPTAAGDSWTTRSFLNPVAILPVEDGVCGLLLDRPADGRWSLTVLDLATGEVQREILPAPSVGDPVAMAYEPGERSVVVLLSIDGGWQVQRVDLTTSERRVFLTFGGAGPEAPARGIASLSRNTAVVTAGNSLVWVDYTDLAHPTTAVLLGDLEEPHDVIRDPLHPDRVYIAERGADRVVSFDLTRRVRQRLPTNRAGRPGFLRPTSLAFEQGGKRLLALTDANPNDSARELVGIGLFREDPGEVFDILTDLPASACALATGPDGLRLVILPEDQDIAIGGGIEQKRTIVDLDVARCEVTVDSPFDPPLRTTRRWRVPDHQQFIQTSSGGTSHSFFWDTGDLAGTGEAFLRMTSFDTDLGETSELATPRLVSDDLDVPAIEFSLDSAIVLATALVDLDGDGDVDLVTAEDDRMRISWNFAGRIFPISGPCFPPGTCPQIIVNAPNVSGLTQVDPVDIDGDGRVDLVSPAGDKIVIFRQGNDGVLALSDSLSIPGVDEYAHVEVSDLDSDGDLDVVSSGGSHVVLFRQDDVGGFEPTPILADAQLQFGKIVAADLEADGDPDLVVLIAGPIEERHRLATLEQLETGEFVAGVLESPGGWRIEDIEPGDLDADGDLDLVLCRDPFALFTGVEILHQERGEFVAGAELDMTSNARSVRVADLDGDRDLDLLVGTFSGVASYFQSDTGSFLAGPTLKTGQFFDLGDVDGDGDLDVVTAMQQTEPPRWLLATFEQSSPGDLPDSFDSPSESTVPGFDFVVSLMAADLDRDGDLDVAFVDPLSNRIGLLYQIDPRIFVPGPTLTVPDVERLRALTAGDLDSDGDIDLVAIGEGSDSLALFLQDQDGELAPGPLLQHSSVQEPLGVTIGDLDRDGDVDLVCANAFGSDSLTFFYQLDPGSFLPLEVALTCPSNLELADLDQDGDRDLVAARPCSRSMKLLFLSENRGEVQQGPPLLQQSGFPRRPTVGDLDGDGDLDLVSVNESCCDGRLELFLQVDRGVFATGESLRLGGGRQGSLDPLDCPALDYDGDGDLDLVPTTKSFFEVLYLQTDPGVFTRTRQFLPRASGASSLTADLDGDGEIDRAFVSFGRLVVFYGGDEK